MDSPHATPVMSVDMAEATVQPPKRPFLSAAAWLAKRPPPNAVQSSRTDHVQEYREM